MPYPALLTPADYFHLLEKHEIFAEADRPIEVDLGCGDGKFLEALAALHPDRNFLGVERLQGRVEKTARRIERLGLRNARVLRLESSYTVGWLLPVHGIARLHLLCPDPWPKLKHHQRRLLNDPEFLDGLERALERGGEFLLKTDDLPYYENAVEVMQGRAAMARQEWPDDAFPYPQTSFEKLWRGEGKAIHRARWRFLGSKSEPIN